MIEKALIIIIFMYALNFSMLGIQFMYADVVGHEMVNHEGVPITSNIQNYINISQLYGNIVHHNAIKNYHWLS